MFCWHVSFAHKDQAEILQKKSSDSFVNLAQVTDQIQSFLQNRRHGGSRSEQ